MDTRMPHSPLGRGQGTNGPSYCYYYRCDSVGCMRHDMLVAIADPPVQFPVCRSCRRGLTFVEVDREEVGVWIH